MTKQSTEVAIIEQLNSNGMEKTAAEQLLSSYGVPFVEAGKLIEQGRQIVVSDESDTENMALARTTRLALRSQRIAIEKKHDELKADSLAYGKAVDLVQRVALEQIKPVEEHLQLQEKFAEVQQEKRRQERINERTAKLAQYVDDVSVYNYGDMGDDAFALLIDQVRDAKEKREAEEKAAAEKAEQERREREEADKLAREKAEAEAAEQRKLREAAENEARKEREAAATAKAVADRIAAEQRAKVEKAEAELRAERERIAAEKAAAEAVAAEQARIEREAAEKAAGAPDKEKLLAAVDAIEFEVGILESAKGQAVTLRIAKHLAKSLEAYRKLINEEL